LFSSVISSPVVSVSRPVYVTSKTDSTSVFAVIVKALVTARFVLLIMLETTRISELTAILEPIVKIPKLLATLNLVFVPVTKMLALATFTRPETVLVVEFKKRL
jgi:hypothetical protein